MNRIKNGISATYITFLIQIVVSFVASPIIIQKLGESTYGVYQIALAVASYLSVMNFGIPHAYYRFAPIIKNNDKDGKSIRCFNGQFFIIMVALSISSLFLGLIIAHFSGIIFSHKLSNNELELCEQVIIVLSINTSISIFSQVFSSFIITKERFAFEKTINCLYSVLLSVFTIFLLFAGHTIISVVILTLLLSIAKLVFLYFYCRKKLQYRISFSKWNNTLIKPVFAFSVFLFINLISDQVNWSIDRLLLGIMTGTSAVASYGVGIKIQNMYMQLMIAISSVFITRINNLSSENSFESDCELNKLFINVGRIQSMLSCMIIFGFALFGKLFIDFWVGKEYSNSYYVAIILIISATPLYIQNIGTEIQRAKGMHKFRAYTYIIMCVFNLLISINLIRTKEEIGAAIGTAISLFIGEVVVTNIYYQKVVGLDVFSFWKQSFKVLVGVIPSFVISFFIIKLSKPTDFLEAIPQVISFTVLFFVNLYLTVLTKDEKQGLKKLIIRQEKNE